MEDYKCMENKPKFSRGIIKYSLIMTACILFFIVFVSNVEWEIRINGLFGFIFVLVILPLCIYLYFFLKTVEPDKICYYRRKYISIISAIVIVFVASVVGIYSVIEAKNKEEIVAQICANANDLGLENVTIKINSKNIEYGYYNVVVECSNLEDFSSSELFEIDRNIGCNDSFITSYFSNGDVYRIYPSTLSIYKNGESIYSDYWNSSSHKKASTDKSGYGGYNGTRPGSVAESIERNGANVKCKECGRHSDNGVNSLCDLCREKKNDN